jgi:hypothetical protein
MHCLGLDLVVRRRSDTAGLLYRAKLYAVHRLSFSVTQRISPLNICFSCATQLQVLASNSQRRRSGLRRRPSQTFCVTAPHCVEERK